MDRQSVRVRRLRARVGIITRRSDEVQPEEGGRGGGVCPGEEGRDQRDRCQRHCRPHESLGGASAPTKKSDGNDDATTEKKPVTTANPDNGIVSPPSGTSKSTPMARALDCCTFCCTDPKVQPPSGGKRAVTDMTCSGLPLPKIPPEVSEGMHLVPLRIWRCRAVLVTPCGGGLCLSMVHRLWRRRWM